jgi:hypothetical protein
MARDDFVTSNAIHNIQVATEPALAARGFDPAHDTVRVDVSRDARTGSITNAVGLYITCDSTKTKTPRATLLTNPDLHWLESFLSDVRACVRDIFAWPDLDESTKADHLKNCELHMSVLQGALRQHHTALRLERRVKVDADSIDKLFENMLTLSGQDADEDISELFANLVM